MNILPTLVLCALCALSATATHAKTYDLVVYGGTSGGVAASIQAARMNKSVVLIEPTRRLGGLTTGGLGQTDIGNKQVIGGIAHEFYQGIKRYYQDPAHWPWQDPEAYRSGGQSRNDPGEEAMWTFEPSAALAIEDDIPVRQVPYPSLRTRLLEDGQILAHVGST